MIMFERRLITNHLVEKISEALGPKVPVAVAELPDRAGWEGQPRADGSNFQPYSVVTPLTASTSSGSLGLSQTEWQLPFALTSYGASADQAEWMADRARITTQLLADETLVVSTIPDQMDRAYVQQVQVLSLGTLTKSQTAIQPAFWSQSDSVSLWLSAEFS